MPRIEVQPHALDAAGGAATGLAGELTEIRGQVEALGRQAADAAGEPGAAAAASGCGQFWGDGVKSLSEAVAKLGTNTSAAATAYTATDENAIPEGAP